jgi:Flp pilus assembly protein TadD
MMEVQQIEKTANEMLGAEGYAWSEGGLRTHLGLKEEDLAIALSLGNAKMKAGEFQAAFRIYCAIALCQPEKFEHHQALANLCLKANQFDAAVRVGTSMILLKPENPLGFYTCGAAYLALGRRDEARGHIETCLGLAEVDEDVFLQKECQRLLQQIEHQ